MRLTRHTSQRIMPQPADTSAWPGPDKCDRMQLVERSKYADTKLAPALKADPGPDINGLVCPGQTWRRMWRAEVCGIQAGLVLPTLHICAVYQQA